MPIWKQRLLARYHAPQPDDGGSGGGGGGGDKDGEGAEGTEGAEGDKNGDKNGAEGDKGDKGDKGGDKKPSLTDKEAELLKENMKKKEALQNAQKALEQANARLKEFDGVDAAEIKKLLQERKDAETKALEAKGEWDRLKQRMADEHQKATKALQDKVNELTAQLNTSTGTINELTVGSAFAQSAFLKVDTVYTPAKARTIYGAHFDLVDGQVVGYDKPRGAANRTMLVDASGTPVGFEEAIRKIVEADPEKDEVLRSKMKPGAGSESRQRPASKDGAAPTDSIAKIGAGLATLKIN